MTRSGSAGVSKQNVESIPLEIEVELLRGELFRTRQLANSRLYLHQKKMAVVQDSLERMKELVLRGKPLLVVREVESLRLFLNQNNDQKETK